MATVSSKQYSVNWRDILRGASVAGGSALTAQLLVMINAEDFVIKWKVLAVAFIGGFAGYLMKNFFSESKIEIKPVSDLEAEAVKNGEAKVVVIPQENAGTGSTGN